MAATIRLAGVDDVPAIAALRRLWVEEYDEGPVADDGFEDAFAEWFEREQDRRVVWVAEVDGEPVGMLNLMIFNRMPRPGRAQVQWGYLANFFVHPAHRDSGIGAEMLHACTTYADEHGFVRIVLSPSERSVPLYRRSGFGPADELLLRPGPPST